MIKCGSWNAEIGMRKSECGMGKLECGRRDEKMVGNSSIRNFSIL